MDKETQANSEVAVMEVARSVEVHNGKKEEEETSLDGDFIKVEKEAFDGKGNSHVAEAKAVKSEVRSLTDPKITDAYSREELMAAHSKVKELEIELGKVTNALKDSESDNVQVKDQLSSAKEKLNQMAKGEEKLNMQLKNLQEDLEIVLSKHKEHSGIKEAFEHLNVELESSKKKMKDLEQELQSSVSDSRKFEELHIKSASHLESETKRAEELERLVEAAKLSAKDAENQMASLQEELKGLRAKIVDNDKTEASLKSKTVELSAKDSLIDEMYKEIGLVKNSERQLKENTLALESLLSSTQKDHQLKVFELKEIQLKHSEEVSAKKSIAQALEAKEELAKVAAAKKEGLEAALEQMKRTCAELETKLKLSKEEFGKADAFSAEVTIKNAELEHKLTFFEQLLSESKSSEASAVQKNLEFEDLVGKLKSAEGRLEQQAKVLEESMARTAEFESLNATLIRDSDLKLQEHVKSFTNKESEMKYSCENLELLIEFQKKAYEDKLAEAASKAAGLSEELNEAEKRAAQSLLENELLAETNSQHKSKVGEIQKLLDTATVEKVEADQQLASHINTLKVHEVKVRESSEIAESRKVELDQTHVKLHDQQIHIEVLETKSAQLETNIGALAEANMKLNEELAVSESKLNDLQSKLSQALAEKNDAVKNLCSSTKIVEDLTKELASERQRLQTEISSLMEQKQHLGDTSATAQTGLQTLITQLEGRLKERTEVLKSRVKELEEKLLVTESDLRKKGDEAEVTSRDIGLDLSSPTKRKNKKSESSSTQTPSASAETKTKTIQAPSSLNNLKLVIGVAIISIIIGLILGKRY